MPYTRRWGIELIEGAAGYSDFVFLWGGLGSSLPLLDQSGVLATEFFKLYRTLALLHLLFQFSSLFAMLQPFSACGILRRNLNIGLHEM